MTRITFLLHYMLERLEVMGDWSLRRVNTPDGYACLMKVGEVEFLWCKEDVASMYFAEDEDWGSKLTLHEKVRDCIINGVTYEKGKEKGGEE